MLDSIILQSCAALAAVVSVMSFARHRRAAAAGAVTMAVVLAGAALAAAFEVRPWVEGGFPMTVLALCGSCAIGVAVASRLSLERGPFRAALIGIALTLLAGGSLYAYAISTLSGITQQFEPVAAALIMEAGKDEAVRILQLAGLLAAVAALLLLLLRRRPGTQHGHPGVSSRATDGEGARNGRALSGCAAEGALRRSRRHSSSRVSDHSLSSV